MELSSKQADGLRDLYFDIILLFKAISNEEGKTKGFDEFKYLGVLFLQIYSREYLLKDKRTNEHDEIKRRKKTNEGIIKGEDGKDYYSKTRLEKFAKNRCGIAADKMVAGQIYEGIIRDEKGWINAETYPTQSFYRLSPLGLERFLIKLDIFGNHYCIRYNDEKFRNVLEELSDLFKDQIIIEGSKKQYQIGIASDLLEKLKQRVNQTNFEDRLKAIENIANLVNLGLDMTEGLRKAARDAEGLAFCALMETGFNCVNDFFEAKQLHVLIKKNSSKESIRNLFLEGLFSQPSDSSYLSAYIPHHHFVSRLRSLIIGILEDEDNSDDIKNNYSQIIDNFPLEFNINIVKKADENDAIRNYIRMPDYAKPSKDLVEHLEKSKKAYLKKLNKKTLCKYIPQQATFVDTSIDMKQWNNADEDIMKKCAPSNAEKLISSALNQNDTWYIIVGSSFGMGKTVLVERLCSNYASNYLDKMYGKTTSDANYIPILLSLENRLDVDQDELEMLLTKILDCNQNNRCKPQILLIVDGLDQYNGNTEEIMTKLKSIHRTHGNMKAIITCRTNAISCPVPNLKNYIRILPFNDHQVNCFFEKYKLTFDDLRNFGISDKEISNPLLCLIFALFYKNPEHESILKRQIESVRKALIYNEFVNSLKNGKYREKGSDISDGRKEIGILRKVAALKQLYGDDLTLKNVENGIRKFNNHHNKNDDDVENIVERFESIKKSYLRCDYHDSLKIDFISESFKNYFLAEYYLEGLLEDKHYRLNTNFPAKETIICLDGILSLLFSNDDLLRQIIKEILTTTFELYEGETKKVFKFDGDTPDQTNPIIHLLFDRAKNFYGKEQIYYFGTENITTTTENITEEKYDKELWHRVPLAIVDAPGIWSYKWLLVFISNKLDPTSMNSGFDKPNLVKLISKTSHAFPSYIKRLEKVNLNNTDLSGIDLSGKDVILSGADFNNSDLVRANLSKANLSKAIFDSADLSNADLSNTDMKGAYLTSAVLFHTDLSGSDLKGAILDDAMFIGTDLTGVIEEDLRGSKILASDPLPTITMDKSSDATISNFPMKDSILHEKSAYKQLIDYLSEKLHTELKSDYAIRYVGICDVGTLEFKEHHYNSRLQSARRLLSQKEKKILLMLTWQSWKYREQFERKIGRRKYSLEVFDKIKRITIKLEHDDHLLFITTEPTSNHNGIIEDIFRSLPDNDFKCNSTVFNISNYGIEDLPTYQRDTKADDFCEKLVKQNNGIRFACICDLNGKFDNNRYPRTDLPPLYLNSNEQKNSVQLTAKKWKNRQRFIRKIGKGLFAMAEYERIKRIAFPFGDDKLLVMTTETNCDHRKIVENYRSIR